LNNNESNAAGTSNSVAFSKNIKKTVSNEYKDIGSDAQVVNYDNAKILQEQLDLMKTENNQLRFLMNKNAEINDKAQIEIKELNEKVNTYKKLLEDQGASDSNILTQRIVELQEIVSSVSIENNLLDAQLANMRYVMKEKGQQNINLYSASNDKMEFERSKVIYNCEKNYTTIENIALNIENELQYILNL
jgi:hypothetical protein